MDIRLEDRPDWTDNLLQGLAYWIGYKKQYYNFYPLSEGAIVGEAMSLLASNIDMKSMHLNAEIMYNKICTWSNNERADIVISKRPNEREKDKKGKKKPIDYSKFAREVIEVKKHGGNPQLINNDLKRLADCLDSSNIPELRCFLLLVSQEGKPQKPDIYVKDEGKANRSHFKINNRPNYATRVRRVCKATSKFDTGTRKAADNAYYACLLEVVKVHD